MPDERNPGIDVAMLLASSVHDIKNSLGMILGTLDEMIAEQPPPDQRQRDRYAVLRGESARINGDLIALLGLYQISRDRLPLHLDEHYIQDLFDDAIALITPLLALRGVEVECRCDATVHAFCDARLISSVLNNALVNALRYTGSRITLSARQRGGGCVIEIDDDGPGFPEFMLGASENTPPGDPEETRAGSTRLGLHFAREIAYRHRQGDRHGFIELSNPPEGGGRFSLNLP